MKIHIIPNDDWIEHTMNEECICGPSEEYRYGNFIYLHHALDGRERDEEDYAQSKV